MSPRAADICNLAIFLLLKKEKKNALILVVRVASFEGCFVDIKRPSLSTNLLIYQIITPQWKEKTFVPNKFKGVQYL